MTNYSWSIYVRVLRLEKIYTIHRIATCVDSFGFDTILTSFPKLRELVCYRPSNDEIYKDLGNWYLLNKLPTALERHALLVESPKLSVYYYSYERHGDKVEAEVKPEASVKVETDVSDASMTDIKEDL